MPVRYVQTLGAVAGIPQVVNMVEITMEKPAGAVMTMAKPAGAVITITPTLTPDYGGGD